jgi:hypothetical protein
LTCFLIEPILAIAPREGSIQPTITQTIDGQPEKLVGICRFFKGQLPLDYIRFTGQVSFKDLPNVCEGISQGKEGLHVDIFGVCEKGISHFERHIVVSLLIIN